MSSTDQCSPKVADGKGRAARNGQQPEPSDTRENPGLDRSVGDIHRVFTEDREDLVRYSRSRVKSPEAAQDIVQQAFTNTLTAVTRGVRIRDMSSFLRRCVHNLSVNYTVSDSPLELDEELFVLTEKSGRLTEKSAAASAEIGRQWHAVASALDGLSPSQRHAFVLAELQGLGCEEIAESMNCSTGAVWQLLFRARREIRMKVGASSDWLGGSIPALGAGRILADGRHSAYWHVSVWVRAKMAEVNSLVGTVFQRSAEALQPNVSVATSAVVVALVTVTSPQLGSEGPPVADPVKSNVQRSTHSSPQPREFVSGSIDRQSAPVSVKRVPRPFKVNEDERKPASRKGSADEDRREKAVEKGHGNDGASGKVSEGNDPAASVIGESGNEGDGSDNSQGSTITIARSGTPAQRPELQTPVPPNRYGSCPISTCGTGDSDADSGDDGSDSGGGEVLPIEHVGGTTDNHGRTPS